MKDLTLAYLDQGCWNQAQELQAQVTETHLEMLPAEHPDTLKSIRDLPLMSRDQAWSMKGKLVDAPEYSSLHQPINNQDSQSSWQSL